MRTRNAWGADLRNWGEQLRPWVPWVELVAALLGLGVLLIQALSPLPVRFSPTWPRLAVTIPSHARAA